MHYNANTSNRPTLGRKVKRVSDVNAMGYTPYDPATNLYPNVDQTQAAPQIPPQPTYQTHQQSFGAPQSPSPQMYAFAPQTPFNNAPQMPNNAQFGIFGQPMVQNMAMQYGQQLADTGKSMLKDHVERIVPVSSLKYYFAVDTKYVISKLILLFFPFVHKDWSVKYEQDSPVQPRFEINAPDLYIPSMAYVTYVLVAGMCLGMQQRFSPEQIGIVASSALAWVIVELVLYSCTLYIASIKTTLRTLDLLSFSGYKFVGIIAVILMGMLGGKTIYYGALVYLSLAIMFFLLRALKVQVLVEVNVQTANYYGAEPSNSGHKRRLYFLLFVAGLQPVLSWWLSSYLIPELTATTTTTTN